MPMSTPRSTTAEAIQIIFHNFFSVNRLPTYSDIWCIAGLEDVRYKLLLFRIVVLLFRFLLSVVHLKLLRYVVCVPSACVHVYWFGLFWSNDGDPMLIGNPIVPGNSLLLLGVPFLPLGVVTCVNTESIKCCLLVSRTEFVLVADQSMIMNIKSLDP